MCPIEVVALRDMSLSPSQPASLAFWDARNIASYKHWPHERITSKNARCLIWSHFGSFGIEHGDDFNAVDVGDVVSESEGYTSAYSVDHLLQVCRCVRVGTTLVARKR